MTFTIGPELAARLESLAQQQGTTPEQVALEILRQRITPVVAPSVAATPESPVVPLPVPRDDWERRVLAIAKPCAVVLPDSALSREEIYD